MYPHYVILVRIASIAAALLGVLAPALKAVYWRRWRTRQRPLPESTQIETLISQEADNARIAIISSIFEPAAYLVPFLENLSSIEEASECEFVIVAIGISDQERNFLIDWSKNQRAVKIFTSSRNMPVYQAWNLAIQHSSAPLITNANVDDLKQNDLISRQLAHMDKHPEISVAYTDYFLDARQKGSSEHPTVSSVRVGKQTLGQMLFMGTNFAHASPVWRRTIHAEVGLFDSTFNSSGDADLWLRCLMQGIEFDRIPGPPGYVYRLNENGLSTKADSLGRVEWGISIQKRLWALLARKWSFLGRKA